MKKNPAKKYEKETGRHPYIGTMAEESNLRRQQYLQTGCNAFDSKRPKSTPMGFWTEQDVLQYLLENNLDYAPIYGKIVKDSGGGCYRTTGESRTGCVFCAFGCHLEKEPNKFQRMKITHPKLYDYCMNNLNMDSVLSYMSIPH